MQEISLNSAKDYIASLQLDPGSSIRRRDSIGGSDAPRIMAGDWNTLWREKTGKTESEDLTGLLRVQMGKVTERLNLNWYLIQRAKKYPDLRVAILDQTQTHPRFPWATANFDGFAMNPHPIAVIDAKHTSSWTTPEEIQTRSYAQMQHYMWVTGIPFAHLSVFFGNDKWEIYEIPADPDYIKALADTEKNFWFHIENNVEPMDPGANAAGENIRLPAVKKVAFLDLKEANVLALMADVWLKNRHAAKAFTEAEGGIKKGMPEDAAIGYGFGVACIRDKAGKMKILPLDRKLADKHKIEGDI